MFFGVPFSFQMVEEVTVKEAEGEAGKAEEALASHGQVAQASNEATIDSNAQGGAESSCNDTFASPSDPDREKSLEYADQLMEKGSKAVKEGDFAEATDCFSRALEIRLGFLFLVFKFVSLLMSYEKLWPN